MGAAVIARRAIRGAAAQTLSFRSLSSLSPAGYKEFNPSAFRRLAPGIKIRDSDVETVREIVDRIKQIHKVIAYPLGIQATAMSTVLDAVQEYPLAARIDPFEAFHLRVLNRSTLSSIYFDRQDGITKDEVTSRVLDVFKLHFDVDQSKLAKEGHFEKDLGLNIDIELIEVYWGLKREFKLLQIPPGIETMELLIDYIYEIVRQLSSGGNPTVDDINSTASLVVRIIDGAIRYKSTDPDYDFNTDSTVIYMMCTQFSHYSFADRIQVISRVLDHIEFYPQVEKWMVYNVRLYCKSLSNNDGKDDITRDQIVSRVLDVIKNNPKISNPSKVNEESDFYVDLDLDLKGVVRVLHGLVYEFKLDMPSKYMRSCKSVIDYIYMHRRNRWSLEDFDHYVSF